MVMEMNEIYKKIIELAGQKHGLPQKLIAAICEVESNWQTCANRYEPEFAKRYVTVETVKPVVPCTFNTEAINLSTSWGLMQVMGMTARELGFDGPYLGALMTDPALGVDYGCRLLKSKWRQYYKDYGLGGVVAAYNVGSPRMDANGQWVNQQYVDNVMSAMKRYVTLWP
jgi:soluble lytic murein transglycosylase-like protein